MTSPTTTWTSRVQLALNVDDIDRAVEFYSALFDAEPVKRRPGYANFAIDQPPLKLALFESPGAGGTLNHLGVEVPTTDDVDTAQRRLTERGLASFDERDTTCCYARQDKFWVDGGQGVGRWEVYTVLADAGAELEGQTASTGESCCTGDAKAEGCCA